MRMDFYPYNKFKGGTVFIIQTDVVGIEKIFYLCGDFTR